MTEFSTKLTLIKQQIKYSVHLGHKVNNWNSNMAPYLLYSKNGYYIFDLLKTSKFLKIAGYLLYSISKRNGTFLFVGTEPLFAPLIKKYATYTNSFYINFRWLAGLLTNWQTNKKQLIRLNLLETLKLKNYFITLSKTETIKILKELNKLQRLFTGIKNMIELPDVVIFINQTKDLLAIKECLNLGIPVISLVDTNSNPNIVPYPVFTNDDSLYSVSFILNYLTNQIIKGKNTQIN
jgi:small subunit ribosomal protein S2